MGRVFGAIKVKGGMKGSSAGRGRGEKTAELKGYSKKARRRQGRNLARARGRSLNEMWVGSSIGRATAF